MLQRCQNVTTYYYLPRLPKTSFVWVFLLQIWLTLQAISIRSASPQTPPAQIATITSSGRSSLEFFEISSVKNSNLLQAYHTTNKISCFGTPKRLKDSETIVYDIDLIIL